uniref:Uncharacterized protein n=1 Tax=Arundo donax TaxID=35708 RepID=A0A0A8Z6J9_ARUDO
MSEAVMDQNQPILFLLLKPNKEFTFNVRIGWSIYRYLPQIKLGPELGILA